jgi:lysophospholipase L1-like esterase
VLCLVLTGAQTAISKSHDTGDMEELKDELSDNANNLALVNDEQMKNEFQAQLSYINYMLEKETNIIGLASETRASSGGEKALEQLQSLQMAAQAELTSYEQTRNNVSVTCLGDSVMLGATENIQEQIAGAYVSAAVSRQIEAGPEIINTLSEHGILGNIVVVHLGTNGVSSLPKYQAIVDAIGPDRTIYWVNCRGVSWANDVNINIQQIVDANPNVNLVNWVEYSEGHPEYFYSDNIHLTTEGRAAYAEMIKAAVSN